MKVINSRIIENKIISNKIFKLKVEFSGNIIPGQFFMLKTLDNSFLLPRPISVNDYNNNEVTFLYRIEGVGTNKISTMKENELIQLFGPLGNGFDLNELKGRVAIIGGGIGIAPLLYLTKSLGKKADAYLGYKDSVYLDELFRQNAANTLVSTENGCIGEKGFITDFIDFNNYDTVVTCGPEIMMNKIIEICRKNNINCFVSLERRMACGMGVCLGCTVETKDGYKRACKDGPVFLADELR